MPPSVPCPPGPRGPAAPRVEEGGAHSDLWRGCCSCRRPAEELDGVRSGTAEHAHLGRQLHVLLAEGAPGAVFAQADAAAAGAVPEAGAAAVGAAALVPRHGPLVAPSACPAGGPQPHRDLEQLTTAADGSAGFVNLSGAPCCTACFEDLMYGPL